MIEQAEGERLRDYARRLQDERNGLAEQLEELNQSAQNDHAEIMRLLKEMSSYTRVLENILDRLLQEDQK